MVNPEPKYSTIHYMAIYEAIVKDKKTPSLWSLKVVFETKRGFSPFLIPVIGSQRQEGLYKFKARLVSVVNHRSTIARL